MKKATLKAILENPDATDDQKRAATEALQALETASDLDEIQMEEDFQAWLLGKGRTEDHMRTPWGRTPLTHNEDVVRYCKQFTDKRQEFFDELTKIWLNIESGNPSIKDLFMYYRFFVRGKLDPDSMDDLDYMSFWREMTSKTWAQDNQKNPNLEFVDKEVLKILDTPHSLRTGKTYQVRGQDGGQLLGAQERGLFRATQVKQTLLVAAEVLRGLSTDVNLVGKAEVEFENKRQEVQRFFDQPKEVIDKFLENFDTTLLDDTYVDKIMGEYVTRWDQAAVVVQKDELSRLRDQRKAFEGLDRVARQQRIANRAAELMPGSTLARAERYKFDVEVVKYGSKLGKIRWATPEEKEAKIERLKQSLGSVRQEDLNLLDMQQLQDYVDTEIKEIDRRIAEQQMIVRTMEADPDDYGAVILAIEGDDAVANARELQETRDKISEMREVADYMGKGSQKGHLAELMSTIVTAKALQTKQRAILDPLSKQYDKVDAEIQEIKERFEMLAPGSTESGEDLWDQIPFLTDAKEIRKFATEHLDDVFKNPRGDDLTNDQLEGIWRRNREFVTNLAAPTTSVKSDYHRGLQSNLMAQLRKFSARITAMDVNKADLFGERTAGFKKIAAQLETALQETKLEDMIYGEKGINRILSGLQDKLDIQNLKPKDLANPEFRRQRNAVVDLFNSIQESSERAEHDFAKRQQGLTDNALATLKQKLDTALSMQRSERDILMRSVQDAFSYYQKGFVKEINDAKMSLVPESE